MANALQNKQGLGFWSLIALVVGSQIGSGIFLLPTSLAPFGTLGLSSWLITATGAILLSLVFAHLSEVYPKTGGPHVFIEGEFGHALGFFSAWTYWIISWMSTPIVIISIVSYLSPILGNSSPYFNLTLEIIILLSFTFLNLSGVNKAGKLEFIFSVLKIVPLLIVPIVGLFYLNWDYFLPLNPTDQPPMKIINAAALLTLWGFIGVETATTPADSVINPKKNIPRALIIGTSIVAFIYILCSFSIMGVLPASQLMQSKAPFADVAQAIFGGHWQITISIIAAIICLGTLNAWILTSGQIALGAAEDNHLPALFKIKNKKGAPIWGLCISSICMLPILILMMDLSLIDQINKIIDVSVTAFLLIYFLSTLSYLSLLWKNWQTKNHLNKIQWFVGIAAFIFCSWSLWAAGLKTLSQALIISLMGIPVYLWQKKYKLNLKLKEI